MILDNLDIYGYAHGQIVIAGNGNERVRFEDALGYPGLINSHDHLDFNLFPTLGNRHYVNYTEWAHDIHTNSKSCIEKVLNIPEDLRVQWGGYKNLLNGFTTVVNHGKKVKDLDSPVRIYQECHSLHSTAFEKNWKWKLNNPFSNGKPYVMHIGEGIDSSVENEINEVIRWNKMNKKIVAVHGIALSPDKAKSFSALVWCPASNYKLIGKTANVRDINSVIPVVFGTDSTLSAGWNAWEHFREAHERTGLGETELIEMLTSVPSEIWKIKNPGSKGVYQDLVVIKKRNSFFDINPEDILMVVTKGEVRMVDKRLQDQLPGLCSRFTEVGVGDSRKFVEGDLPNLVKKIRSHYPAIELPVII